MWNRLFVIILLNIIVYYKSIFYEYVSDDKDGYEGKNPIKEHSINLLIHILNCLLIYLVFGRNNISFITSVLFAVHPINMQGGSVWISGRPYSCATMVLLTTMLFPLFFPVGYIVSALYISANIFLSPLLFLFTHYWYLSFMILGIWFVAKKQTLNKIKSCDVNKQMLEMSMRKLIPAIKSYGFYFIHCLIPYEITFYHNFCFGIGLNKEYNENNYAIDRNFLIGLALVYFVVTNVFFNYNEALRGLFWFSVCIVMWCNFVTIQQNLSERYVYLATIGMMYALANTVIRYPYIAVAFFIYYLTRTLTLMPMFSSEYWLLHYSISEEKDNWYVWNMMGFNQFVKKNIIGAQHHFFEALRFNTHDFKIYYNIANIFLLLQQLDKAEEYLKKAEQYLYYGREKEQMECIVKTRNLIQEAREKKVIDILKIQIVK